VWMVFDLIVIVKPDEMGSLWEPYTTIQLQEILVVVFFINYKGKNYGK